MVLGDMAPYGVDSVVRKLKAEESFEVTHLPWMSHDVSQNV